MTVKLDRRSSALVEVCCTFFFFLLRFKASFLLRWIKMSYFQVQSCGSMVTEEQPDAMLIPMEYFLMGYGMYRPSHVSVSPRSPLSPSFIAPELLSPESMGLKLKPIKTRISLEVWRTDNEKSQKKKKNKDRLLCLYVLEELDSVLLFLWQSISSWMRGVVCR